MSGSQQTLTYGPFAAPSRAAQRESALRADYGRRRPSTRAIADSMGISQRENVTRGLHRAFLVFPAGAVVLAVYGGQPIVRLAVVAACVLAAVALYVRGAGTAPRSGAAGLALVVVLGLALVVAGYIVGDTWRVAQALYPDWTQRVDFVGQALTNGEAALAHAARFVGR